MGSHTLYATPDRTRFFHVPDDARLPPGDFEVRSMTGRRLAVEGMAIEVYEVSEAEATRITRELVASVAEKARNVLGALFASPPPAVDPGDQAAREKRVADALNVTPGQLHDDPKAVGAAIGSMFDAVVKAAREAIANPDVTRERLKDAAEALRQEGADPETVAAVEAVPERLRELLTSDETLAKVDELTAEIKSATRRLREEAERERLLNLARRQEPGDA
jgi:hypothetical protein